MTPKSTAATIEERQAAKKARNGMISISPTTSHAHNAGSASGRCRQARGAAARTRSEVST